jgi:ATP-dependent Lhr-like helicase
MSPFDRLHPGLQHQVVNALGWRSTTAGAGAGHRAALESQPAGLAPTAGGKTEAAFFPLISEALAGSWGGPAVLYVSPIKALLNNQQSRLERYYGLVGLRAAIWHGDVPASAKKRLLEEPPDCLLTTPESLEVMLVSASIRHDRLFAGVRRGGRGHAFARDDRGWHLLASCSGSAGSRVATPASACRPPCNEAPARLALAGPTAPAASSGPLPPEPPRSSSTTGHLDNAAMVIAACTAARSGWSSATAAPGSSILPPNCDCGGSRRSSRTAHWAWTSASRPSVRSPRATTASSSWGSTSATSTA